MTDTPEPHDTPPPEGAREVATLSWVVEHVRRHIQPVEQVIDGRAELAVMGAAWALGFAGATREQVWWVLRDARLRTAFTSVCSAMARVRADAVPEWLVGVSERAPSDRGQLAAAAESHLGMSVASVGSHEVELHQVLRGAPGAVVEADGSSVHVPADALRALAEVARSVTQADLHRLLAHARGPFLARLDEAAAIAAESSLVFHARRVRGAA